MKLVRDKIIDLFPENFYRVANQTDRIFFLRKKMIEELKEVLDADNPQDFLEELADLMEVANSLRECYGWSQDDLDNARRKKLATRGGFEKGIILM